MLNTHSSKTKYVLAALVGAAAGGVMVALSTRTIPKVMSEMEAKCKQMMASMKECNAGAANMCHQMMADTQPVPEHESCESAGGICHGSD